MDPLNRIKNSGILVISYKSPPFSSMGATRVYYLIKYLKKYFSELTLSTKKVSDKCLNEYRTLDENIQLIQNSSFDYRSLGSKNTSFFRGHKNNGISNFLSRLLNSYPFNLLAGEAGMLYILLSYFRCREIIRKKKIRYIFSSFRPYADHYIAYLLKKRYPSLIWIADFRDPHVHIGGKNVYFVNLQHRFNKKMFNSADYVCTVSDGLAQYFNRYRKDIKILRNGYDSVDFPENLKKSNSTFNITYTGSLYPLHQDASILFRSIKELIISNKIDAKLVKLIYAGKDRDVWENWIRKYHLEDLYQSFDHIPYSKSRGLQMESSVNLVLSWSGTDIKGIITGKIYEYLASGNPILALINGPMDHEFKTLVKKNKNSLVLNSHQENIPRIKSFLMHLYSSWLNQGIGGDKNVSEIPQEYHWKNNIEKFIHSISN